MIEGGQRVFNCRNRVNLPNRVIAGSFFDGPLRMVAQEDGITVYSSTIRQVSCAEEVTVPSSPSEFMKIATPPSGV
jgi:hypothetical protein